MVEIKHNKHSIGQSAYHLVWRPKYNYSVFEHPFPRKVCEDALIETAKKWNIQIYELKVMSDHIHIFVEIPSTMTVSFALQVLKGGSARAFFKRCTVWRRFFTCHGQKAHLWSPGKFFRSVGCVTADVVESYIKNSNKWEFEHTDFKQKKLNAFR